MLRILVISLLPFALASEVCLEGECEETESNQVLLLQSRVRQHAAEEQTPNNGKSSCPCVGIQGTPGQVNVSISGSIYSYPRETASSCQAWDEGRYPGCDTADPPSWCASAWCYVDPCNCDADSVGASPKKSTYFPDSKYQGRELYYSYATCDASDTYSNATVAQADKDAITTICAASVDATVWGNESCRCIGVSNRPGTTTVNISGTTYPYPASYGTVCGAHDSTLPPDCDVASPPSWCASSWCYVDPCSCDIDVLPKYTSYIAGSTVQGRPVYYSYATCASADTWTSTEKSAADQAAIAGICGTSASS